ncbi:MAG: hypothetical protein CM1200mP30_33580 [Pseudomonadota bacterium]|nr:MAG: hypothetical protein CM1200mP30_33580 [Pseudomonadota bacterium]
MERVTAKPLMGPVPNCSRARAAKSVVTFASRIVRKAFPKPSCIAALGFSALFKFSSLMRGKINTFAQQPCRWSKQSPPSPERVLMSPQMLQEQIFLKNYIENQCYHSKNPC